MRFRITLNELLKKENKTKDEEKFIQCYYQRMPLGIAPCTINKICWKIEDMFDDMKFMSNDNFDYSILKCDGVEYSNQLYNKIKKIYDRYRREISDYAQYAKSERLKSEDRQMQKYIFKEQFRQQCLEQCPNEEYLCNIVLDLCYSKSKYSKQFAWDICGDMFIQNLLKRHNYHVTYPTFDEDGDIEFNGQYFSMKTSEIKVNLDIEDNMMEENECR